MSDGLTIEKINADRINRLEEKVDRKLENLETKIDKIFSLLANHKNPIQAAVNGNGNGNGYKGIFAWFAIVVLVVSLIMTIVNGVNASLVEHRKTEGHSALIKSVAQLNAQMKTVMGDVKSLEGKVENFKSRRKVVTDLQIKAESNAIKIEAMKSLMSEKSQDRFTGTRGTLLEKRMDKLEEIIT